ncbi:MAG: hypothetical protein RBR74_05565 [Ignavibacteriaceae bacterium]|jgi:hypothetical protein|nr:hypothetical protein [Ignavibacteriaceae bacterium]
MAKLKKQVLGRVSGALGDMVFREVNGKNVVGMRPSNINIPGDPESIARRAKFTLSAKLSKAIIFHQDLKTIWKSKAPSGLSAHNFLIRSNYTNVLAGDLTDFVKLVPVAGFPVRYTEVTITDHSVMVVLDVIGSNNNINKSVETHIEMLTIIFLSDPVDETVEDYVFISTSSGNVDLSLKEVIEFTAPLIGNDELLFSKYRSNKVFSAFVTKNEAGNAINYSNTLPLSVVP